MTTARTAPAWSIRAATVQDTGAIQALLEANRLPANDLRQHIADFHVAIADAGTLVGVAGLERYGPAALLRSVAVAAGWRRRGVGAALTEACLRHAAACAVREVYLFTEAAAPYFAARGFAPTTRDRLPPAILASPQATTICPQSAKVLVRAP